MPSLRTENLVLVHRCSSRLLSIEAELSGIIRNRDRFAGCVTSFVLASGSKGVWEIYLKKNELKRCAQVGFDCVNDTSSFERYLQQEREASERLMMAASASRQVDSSSTAIEIVDALDAFFKCYGDYLSVYRFTNAEFSHQLADWSEEQLRKSGEVSGAQFQLLLSVDASDTDTRKQSLEWEEIVTSGIHTDHELQRQRLRDHCARYGYLLGDHVFSRRNVEDILRNRFRHDLGNRRDTPPDPSEALQRREALIADLGLSSSAVVLIDRIRSLALLRLKMREQFMYANYLSSHLFEEIRGRICPPEMHDSKYLRLLSNDEMKKALSGQQEIDMGALVRRHESAIYVIDDDIMMSAEADVVPGPGNRHRNSTSDGDSLTFYGQRIYGEQVVSGYAARVSSVEDLLNLRSNRDDKPVILITPMLQPNFIVAGAFADAIVAGEGGVLSHAAVLSREYRIPCIAGIGDNIRKIKNGDLVRLDPGTGQVTTQIRERVPTAKGRLPVKPPQQIQDRTHIKWLGEEGDLPLLEVGSKARYLNRIFDMVNVPPGFCLTAEFCETIIEWDDLRDHMQVHSDSSGDVPAQGQWRRHQQQVDLWKRRLNGQLHVHSEVLCQFELLGRSVVRSSSVEENRTEYSSSGLLTSILDVRTIDQFRSAICDVILSAYSPEFLEYRRSFGLPGLPSCPAVLVQQQIECRMSGVISTIDIISGDPDTILVSVASGTGCGQTGGDRDLIRFSGTGELKSPDLRHLEIDGEELEMLADVAIRMKEVSSQPLELEWGMSLDGTLYVFQSRPIMSKRKEVK